MAACAYLIGPLADHTPDLDCPIVSSTGQHTLALAIFAHTPLKTIDVALTVRMADSSDRLNDHFGDLCLFAFACADGLDLPDDYTSIRSARGQQALSAFGFW